MALDQFLQHWVNQVAITPFLDHLMAVMTNFSAWRPVIVALVVAGFLFGKFQFRAMLCCLVLTLAITDGLVVRNLKHWISRPRPFQSEVGVRQVRLLPASPQITTIFRVPAVSFSQSSQQAAQGVSFPSSHAANIVATMTVLSLFYWRGRWFFGLIALLVMYSRVYTGNHWPSDVLAGCVVGITMALIVFFFLEKMWRCFGNVVAPNLARRYPELRRVDKGLKS